MCHRYSYSSTSLPESVASGWNWLFEPQHPQQEILQRQQWQEDTIAQVSGARHDRRHQRVHPVVIRRRHDGDENQTRISQPDEAVDGFPKRRFLRLPLFQFVSKDTGVVEHGAADDERIAEVHAGHGGEGIDEVAAHPDGGRFVVAHGIQETVFRGKKARGHAGVQGKGQEGEKVGEGEGTADCGEGGV